MVQSVHATAMSQSSALTERSGVRRRDGGMVVVADGPLPRRKRPPKNVLEEDEYVEAIEAIVERDYFPSLKRLRLQERYLRARERGDVHEMLDVKKEYRAMQAKQCGVEGVASPLVSSTPAMRTPSFATPTPQRGGSTPGAGGSTPGAGAATRPDGAERLGAGGRTAADRLSLNAFLERHTSEDNEAYEELAERQREARRRVYHWLHEVEDGEGRVVERQQLLMGGDGSGSTGLPMLEAGRGQTTGKGDDEGRLVTWGYRARNQLMYHPDGVEESEADRQQRALRAGSLDASNTRLAPALDRASLAPPASPSPGHPTASSPTIAADAWELGMAGRRAKADRIDLDALAGASPTHHSTSSYPLVHTPSIEPGKDVDPIMTWGTVTAAPLLLDQHDEQLRSDMHGLVSSSSSSSSSKRFSIGDTPKRELQARELSASAARRTKRKEGEKKKRALMSLLGTPSSRTPSSQLRASYASPSPRIRSSAHGTPSLHTPQHYQSPFRPIARPSASHPKLSPAPSPRPPSSSSSSTPSNAHRITKNSHVTDGLLSL